MALLRERVSEIYRTTRCIFLDCDGVIFDSNGFKLEVEALISKDISYVTEEYTPARLNDGEWLD